MNLRQANIPLIWQWGLWIAVAAFLGGLLGLVVNPAYAAGSVTASVTAVKLYRGATILVSSDPSSTTYRANFTPEACRIEKTAREEAEARTRTSGKVQYKCQIEERDTFTFTAAPPPPPPLPAPTGVTATTVSASEIRVSWNVVADALSYSLRRCFGATCTELSQVICVQGLSQSHVTLPASTTIRYSVMASRDATCGQLGTESAIVSATTLSSGAPPAACVGRVCTLRWTPGDPNGVTVVGWRVHYGLSAEELVHVVQIPNPALVSYQVTVPGPGSWFFAMRAYTADGETRLSNVIARTVQ